MSTLKKSTNKPTLPKKSPTTRKGETPAPRKSSVNFDVIQEYTDFMKSNDLVEIDFKGKDYSVRLRRFEGTVASTPTPQVANLAAVAAPKAPLVVSRSDLHVVKSPFVGTFYRSAGPNQEPFVEEGKIVSAGDPLCIIEAMKLMNEIESDIKGRVVRVLVKNGTPVEFGEGLFEIELV